MDDRSVLSSAAQVGFSGLSINLHSEGVGASISLCS